MTQAPLRFGLVGALDALPRRLAARAAEAASGRLERGTSRRTTHAVFGRTLLRRLAGPDLAARAAAEREAGRIPVSENGFLRRVGLLPHEGGALSRATLLEGSRLEPEALDLLALLDAFGADAEPFAFRDAILARQYAGLIAGGATPAAIARSIHRSGAAASLTARSLRVGLGQAIYADAEGCLSELDGQLLLPVAESEDDPDEIFARAEAAEASGGHEEAADLYRRCLALDATDATAAYNRANCLGALGRAAEAEAEYLRALRADPALVEAWFNLAGLLAAQGRASAARGHLERAIATDPGYSDAVFNLAALAFETGDLDGARRWWGRYLELDPSSDWARTAARGLRFVEGASTRSG